MGGCIALGSHPHFRGDRIRAARPHPGSNSTSAAQRGARGRPGVVGGGAEAHSAGGALTTCRRHAGQHFDLYPTWQCEGCQGKFPGIESDFASYYGALAK